MSSIKMLYSAKKNGALLQSITQITRSKPYQIHGWNRLKYWDFYAFPLEWRLDTPLICFGKDECSFAVGTPNIRIQFNF